MGDKSPKAFSLKFFGEGGSGEEPFLQKRFSPRGLKIGILALQGALAEHAKILRNLNANAFEIRQKSHIPDSFDGLILPGGESTTICKLLDDLQLTVPLKSLIEEGLPTFGTCAGLILLAKNVVGGTPHFAVMDITAKRNAYGRQLGSFAANAHFKDIGEIPMTFIRAPIIEETFGKAQILATIDKKIVAARQNNILATTFHPELTTDKVHKYFLEF
jgi:5'-phosphate synthase pdxT subunit